MKKKKQVDSNQLHVTVTIWTQDKVSWAAIILAYYSDLQFYQMIVISFGWTARSYMQLFIGLSQEEVTFYNQGYKKKRGLVRETDEGCIQAVFKYMNVWIGFPVS